VKRKIDLVSKPLVIKIRDKNIEFKGSVRYLGAWLGQEMYENPLQKIRREKWRHFLRT